MHLRTQPIVAVATAPGRGAVGIVRASGADLGPLIAAVCGRALLPRVATLLPFRDADGSAIDTGLAIHYPAPHSATGEDVLELQAHGGPVVLQLLLRRCLQAGTDIGIRLAAPGEFTERAFLNDKIDLAQAEAVADLIDAGTEAAARAATRSLAGAFSAEIDALADRTVELRALVEATLDFPDEEIDFLEQAQARQRLAAIAAALDAALARARQGALLRDGLQVVIAGQPNVGKSSLLNALAGAERAIVTPIPGTTRDRITDSIQIGGVPLHVTDTAGLRDLADDDPGAAVERIGIRRSREAIAAADVVLFVRDLSRRGEPGYDAADAAVAASLPAAGAVLEVWNKSDLTAGASVAGLRLSAASGDGMDGLRDALLRRAGWQSADGGVVIARERHVQALLAAAQHVAAARDHADAGDARLELLAEELRLAHTALQTIIGAYGSDELLGAIFGRFCIGK